MLVLHLVPDGVGCLHTLLELVLNVHAVKSFTDRFSKFVKQLFTLLLSCFQLLGDASIFIGMLKFETQILKFRFDFVKSESVGKWSVDIECLSCYLVLFVGRL